MKQKKLKLASCQLQLYIIYTNTAVYFPGAVIWWIHRQLKKMDEASAMSLSGFGLIMLPTSMLVFPSQKSSV